MHTQANTCTRADLHGRHTRNLIISDESSEELSVSPAFDLCQQESMMARKFSPAGKVLPGVHIAIIGDEGKPLPVGVSGEVTYPVCLVKD